ncbi:MAG: hypothetical protein LQ345_003344 [Seirophora villosa]|nr:MAG: hypothetical protein LQ345_003344 [Seirophora villosa]
MDRFHIAQDVTKMLPKMQVVVVTAYNLDNQRENRAVDAFASATASATLSDLSAYPNAQSHPRIALYRNTLKAACNLSAKKFPQSNESLYRRLIKEKRALPSINPLADFYNAVSIKHGVTAGAFDLAELQTRSTAPLELRLSAAAAGRDDVFRPLDAKPDEPPLPVPPGELVYVQDGTVLTRHLAWRQAKEALVTGNTRDVIIVSEVFHDEGGGGTMATPTELTVSVADEFVNGLRGFFGVDARATVLGEGVALRTVGVENAIF